MKTKRDKIEFLKGLASGTRSIEELKEVTEIEPDYERMSIDELTMLILLIKKTHSDPLTLSTPGLTSDDINFLKSLPGITDIEERIPRPQFLKRQIPNLNRLTHEEMNYFLTLYYTNRELLGSYLKSI